jgi:hypothetical protein
MGASENQLHTVHGSGFIFVVLVVTVENPQFIFGLEVLFEYTSNYLYIYIVIDRVRQTSLSQKGIIFLLNIVKKRT